MSTAHLVLGLLTLSGGVADNLLRKAGLSIRSVESYLSSRRASVEESTIRDSVALDKSVLAAFERAEAEARSRQHTYLGIEHLLLGILAEESGQAADLFASVHIDRERLKQIIEEEME
jgi:ATP-dependent Clp protease ATP-binding subunit ClpC